MEGLVFCSFFGVAMMLLSLTKSTPILKTNLGLLSTILLFFINFLSFVDIGFLNLNYPMFLSYDSFSKVVLMIFSLLFIFYFLFSWKNFTELETYGAEYMALLFFVMSGIHIIVGFNSLLTLFLGSEIISIPLYVLAGSNQKNRLSNEAAVKYFLSGSFFTAIMLLGIAFLYGSQGTFQIAEFHIEDSDYLFMVGTTLVLFSLAFKASVAPFHFWAPDVYDGSPSLFSGFMSGLVKSSFFIAWFVSFKKVFAMADMNWQLVVAVMVTLTLFLGNLIAIFQNSYKRLLSYSSVAQAGFMLLAVLSLSSSAQQGLILYVASYSLVSICLFSLLYYMKDAHIKNFNGLIYSDPLLAIIVTIMLFSLIGIPATGGFMSKYLLLLSVVETGHFLWLVIVTILFSTMSVFYYFKILKAMFFLPAEKNYFLSVSSKFRSLMLIASIVILILGLRPYWVLDLLYY